MAFALKQRKRRCRVNILNRHHASLCEPPPRHKLSWKYGVFAPLLHCNRNCLSWSLLFDVSHNTRSASPSPFPRAINIPLLSLPAVLHVATSRNARHSPGQSGDPKQKETERRAFELNYFHFRTRSASLFVPRTVFIGMQLPRGGLVSGHGCRPCIRLSLTEKEAMEERRRIRGGFRSRWRESAEAFQVSLPFTVSCLVSSRVDIFIFWNYHVRFFKLISKNLPMKSFNVDEETRSNHDILFSN